MTSSSFNAQPSALFNIQSVGSAQVFSITTPRLFDPAIVAKLDVALRDVLGAHNHIVIDLSHVQFISSAMLGRLVMAWVASATGKTRFVLCGVNDTIAEVFRIAGLHQRFTKYPDVDSAVAALRELSE